MATILFHGILLRNILLYDDRYHPRLDQQTNPCTSVSQYMGPLADYVGDGAIDVDCVGGCDGGGDCEC